MGSKGSLGIKATLAAMMLLVPKRMVEPSAGDLATSSAPMAPVAPTRLSTITGRPRLSDNRGAMTRAATSVGPPVEKGTTSLIGAAD